MLEAIAGTVLNEAAKAAVHVLEDTLKRENAELVKKRQRKIDARFISTTTISVDTLKRHLEQVRVWCSTVTFADLPEHKPVARIYVELDTYLLPLNRHESREERKKVKPLLAALTAEPKHCVVLGGAGAGKTTSLKKVSGEYFRAGKLLLNYNFPILIRLRDLPDGPSRIPLYERLQELLALRVDFPDSDMDIPAQVKEGITARVVESYVNSLEACLLLDGFDEIPTSSLKSAVLANIEALASGLDKTKLIITSRSREFPYSGEAIRRFEIAPLSDQQIEVFARRWLESESAAQDFLKKVMASPFADTAIRPLTIAHLCAIYDRIKDIPDKPKSVYRRVVNLLLKEWDEQRSIQRTSTYSKFDVDRKLEFLAQLAFELTTKVKTLQFDTATLKQLYLLIHVDHGLPKRDAERVALEIESHNGLLVQSGYDNYEFAHKSLQEFLAADYIVRLPSLAALSQQLDLLPNELAIAVALSSRPGEYICELMLRTFDYAALSPGWYSSFASRLAQEKAELTIGHTAFTTIAVFFLFTNLQMPLRYVDMLKPLIPVNAERLVSLYYSVLGDVHGLTELARNSEHPRFSLPKTLRVPGQVLRKQ